MSAKAAPAAPSSGSPVGASADRHNRQPRGQERRDRIIQEAAGLLAAKGFRGMGIIELAERVGMTHSGLLYYFGTKERLLHEVVIERERIELAAMYADLPDDGYSLTLLPAAAKINAEAAMFTRLYFVLATENFDQGDPLHEFFVKRYERTRQFAAKAVTADIKCGRVRDDVDVAQISREVVATFMGLEMQWLMDPDAFDLVGSVESYADGLLERLSPRSNP